MSEAEFNEFVTFTVRAADGSDVELAVLEEFEFDGRDYVAAAKVIDDAIDDEGVYIYRVKNTEEFAVEKITSRFEYREVTEAYTEMCEED